MRRRFSPDDAEELATLKKGQPVKVVGVCKGKSMEPVLDGCRLVR